MVDDATLAQGLSLVLTGTNFEGLGERYEGKVRDNYTRGGTRFIVVTDRISAFDRVLGTIPFKGQVLNALSNFWFEATRDIAKNHSVRMPDPNVLECIECEPLRMELVVRAYITGTTSTSIWTHYAAGKREFCGHALPDGLVRNQPLPAPILTPATKAPKGQHDVSVSRAQLIAQGDVTARDFDAAADMATALFARGQAMAKARGLILVDTKYELGKDAQGNIVIIDEIHTPDSSRYWLSDTYAERFAQGQEPDALDKDYVRRYYAGLGYTGDTDAPVMPDAVRLEAARRYIDAFERITGRDFVPDLNDPLPRIQKNLNLKSQG